MLDSGLRGSQSVVGMLKLKDACQKLRMLCLLEVTDFDSGSETKSGS